MVKRYKADMNTSVQDVYIGKLNARSLVKKDANGRPIDRNIVKTLNCQNNKLNSCLHEFKTFKQLRELILESNNLSDDDIKTLVVPETLKVLDLSTNNLVSLPMNRNHGLRNIEKLLLKGNKIDAEDVIDNLHGFKKLKHLEISFAKIDHIPLHIRRLQSLQFLDITGNDLPENEFPQFICSLKNLKTLRMDYYGEAMEFKENVLEEFLQERVREFCNLQPNENHEIVWSYSRGAALQFMKDGHNLEKKKQWPDKKVLKLWCNSAMLGDLKPEDRNTMNFYLKVLKGLRDATLLSLCTNNFSHMPNIGQFENLQELGLCRNNFKEIPSQVRALPNLTHLYITENFIDRVVFNEDDFASLKFLDLLDNPICYSYEAALACKESRVKLALGEKCQVKGLDAVIENGCDLNIGNDTEENLDENGNNNEDDGDDDLIDELSGENAHSSDTMKPMIKDIKGVPVAVIRSAKLCEINKDTRRSLKMRLDRTTGAGTAANWEDWAEGLGIPADYISYIRDFLVKKQDSSPTDSVIEWALDQDADFTVGQAYDALVKCKAAAKQLLDGVATVLAAKNRSEIQRFQNEQQYHQNAMVHEYGTSQYPGAGMYPLQYGYPPYVNPADRGTFPPGPPPARMPYENFPYSYQPQIPPGGQYQFYPVNYGPQPVQPPPPPYSAGTAEESLPPKKECLTSAHKDIPNIASLNLSVRTGSTSSLQGLERCEERPSLTNYCAQPTPLPTQGHLASQPASVQRYTGPPAPGGYGPQQVASNQYASHHGYSVDQQTAYKQYDMNTSVRRVSEPAQQQHHQFHPQVARAQTFHSINPEQPGSYHSQPTGNYHQPPTGYQPQPPNTGYQTRTGAAYQHPHQTVVEQRGIECSDEEPSVRTKQDRSLSLPSELGYPSMRSPEESLEPGFGPSEQAEPATQAPSTTTTSTTSSGHRSSVPESGDESPLSMSDITLLRKVSQSGTDQVDKCVD
ncbi:uncharacterized protein LOC141903727 isoform X2 [Tubulanus polymorphus]